MFSVKNSADTGDSFRVNDRTERNITNQTSVLWACDRVSDELQSVRKDAAFNMVVNFRVGNSDVLTRD